VKKKKFHIVAAAVLFGTLVWLSVSMRDEYQVTVHAPLVIENIPAGWAIKTPVPRTVELRFRGDGWRLAALMLGQEPKLVIPYETPGSADQVVTLDNLMDRVPVHQGVSLVDVIPDSVVVGLDRFEEKRVPVILDHVFSFRDGYGQVGPVSLTPESVTVGGARSLVHAIELWKTAPGNFDDMKAPVETDLALLPTAAYVLSLSTATVHVRINVQPFAEKIFHGLPVDVLSVPGNREVILIPPKIEVVARSGIKQLSILTPSDFHVTVDYTSITSDTTGFIDAVINPPTGVHVVSKKPERLQYIVRKRL
jgi:hypothetical protein